jgi:hypothetical protein
MGVHCNIYKCSYNVSNISYLNSPPALLSPYSWNSFNSCHFCIYIHVYTLFAPYSSSYPIPCHLLPPTGANHSPPPWTEPVPHNFEEKNIKDKTRNMTFLLVWDKDSYAGSFLELFPCICVLQPQLIHLFQSSLLLPSLLPMVTLASLKFLYLFLYSKHMNHIQIFSFLPLPYLSLAQSPLSVTHIAAFVLGLQSGYEENMWLFGLLSLANFT